MKNSKMQLYSCMILFPGLVILGLYVLTGKIWNVPIVYLILDCVIFVASRRIKLLQLRREEAELRMEESGEGVGQLKSKIDELKELE